MRVLPNAQVRASGGFSDVTDASYDFVASDFGQPGPPVMLAVVMADYDNFDTDWSGEDTLTVTFDRATDHGRQGKAGPRAYVDSLFEFDHVLGEDYSGVWSDLSTFVISSIDTSVNRPLVGKTSVRRGRT